MDDFKRFFCCKQAIAIFSSELKKHQDAGRIKVGGKCSVTIEKYGNDILSSRVQLNETRVNGCGKGYVLDNCPVESWYFGQSYHRTYKCPLHHGITYAIRFQNFVKPQTKGDKFQTSISGCMTFEHAHATSYILKQRNTTSWLQINTDIW